VLQVYNNWPRELTRQLSALKAEIFDPEISEAVPETAPVDLTVEAGAVKENLISGFNGGEAAKNEDKIEQSQPVESIIEIETEDLEYETIIKSCK